jgi:hypothetical protein
MGFAGVVSYEITNNMDFTRQALQQMLAAKSGKPPTTMLNAIPLGRSVRRDLLWNYNSNIVLKKMVENTWKYQAFAASS